MDDTTAYQHEELADSLPDYALGVLGDVDARRVARHLAACPRCQRELDQLLEIVGVLPGVAPPQPRVRETLLARAAAGRPPLAAPSRVPDRAADPVIPVTPPHHPARQSLPRSPIARWSRLRPGPAMLAVAAVLLVWLGAWNVRLQSQVDRQAALAELVASAEAAYPLTDSQLSPPASGVLFAGAGTEQALLVARDLPALTGDQRYQVWLFPPDGAPIGGDLFTVDADGNAQVVVKPPTPLAEFMAVGVSAEPRQGSPSPTSPLALGAWLDDGGSEPVASAYGAGRPAALDFIVR